jgi:hypothetical protein
MGSISNIIITHFSDRDGPVFLPSWKWPVIFGDFSDGYGKAAEMLPPPSGRGLV